MKTNTKEIGFEQYIEERLVDDNSYTKRLPSQYDKKLCMDTELVLKFIKTTQPNEWKKLEEEYGKEAGEQVLYRLVNEIKDRGTLDVLRQGIKDRGISIKLTFFKPETDFNPETRKLYEGNILSVMRQVKYSEKNENSIDMILFLNGLPIFTAELKNQLTGQSVQNGIAQYKNDRDHREALLSFRRCLVHFAVDTDLVYMTTKLAGLKTYFLPFNKGDNNSAGNPVNPDGYKTAYMWEQIWTKDSVLDLVGQFIHEHEEDKEDEHGRKYHEHIIIFPRYHQLDTVRRLIEDSRNNGAGKNYLIQHSAGSGKSNTIAWTAHRLAELHGNESKKVFDSVIVITDRRILDRQLRETVTSFAQTRGVVKAITEGSKELKEALESGEKIITTTLQKFPMIVETVGALPGKKFAVIIDEAHSSQTGESSKSLKQVLNAQGTDKDLDSAEQTQEKEDHEEKTTEDLVLEELRSRKGKTANISFFAFTATPKQKTLELFGVKDEEGKFKPFSLYSMKQAIEERFILDVLKNYTTFQSYFALLKKIDDDPEFSKKKAQRLLINYVERNEHAINKKIEIMADHFHEHIAGEIDGKAKAMIVTKSRLHAVRYRLAMDSYLKRQGLPYQALVAFSGTVKDGDMEYTESAMNGGISEKNTAEEFKKDHYKFLIVAEKFQTGFDQPLLTVMYVDKKLSGVNAVQTLSRLNRIYSSKEEVFVLDFVNETDDIKESFQPYYTTTVLSEETDPNILHDLERDIYSYKMFTVNEVDGFIENYYHNAKPAILNKILDEIAVRFEEYLPEEKDDFKKKVANYTRKYSFISQILSFEDTGLEKLYVFARFLLKKLPVTKERLPYEVLEAIDMDSYKVVKKSQGKVTLDTADGILEPMQSGTSGSTPDEQDILSKIIKEINERFGTNFSTEDKVILNTLSIKLLENKDLEGTIKNNTRDAAKMKFDHIFQDELIKMLNSHFDLYKKLDSNQELKDFVNEKIFDYVQRKLKGGKTE